ncbi:MAG TPA: nickel pincer cofactor biosynthesis protein LarC [Acidimicrobiales bacterium]|nr:nickel pincer cofactor biosynthesis protein LarC [Acidimicrobiales bacterium]
MSDAPAAAARTLAWFHCFAGVAGDMALGSLIDAGADLGEIVSMLHLLPVGGWSLEAEPVQRCGVAATHAVVSTADTALVRTHAHIAGLIEEARLPGRVRDRSLAAFAALAEVEGRLHRRPPAQVHFHEVGGLDAIVDIVGTCAALEILGVDEVRTSPVATGIGVVRTAHGVLPNPAPATVELLRGIPTYGRDINLELTTPTGAALISTLAGGWGPMPAMTITATGYGAGSRDMDELPNCTQVVIGAVDASTPAMDGQPVVLLETNLDDATGETLSHALGALLEAGAHDAWVVPVVMKKGRPGHVIAALCDPALAGQVAGVMRAETGTLGVRGQQMQRWPMSRSFDEVEVDGLPVRIKVSPGRAKVEHDDAARVASLRGLPLREVTRRAEQAWWARQAAEPPDDEPA